MLKHYVKLQAFVASRRKQKGQSLAEYGLILALVTLVCVGALTTMGQNLQGSLNNVATQLTFG